MEDSIITVGDYKQQLDFLKVYPIYNIDIVSSWISSYINHPKKESNIVSFLETALINNLIEIDSINIFKILELIKDQLQASRIKGASIKYKSLLGIKKLSLEKCFRTISDPIDFYNCDAKYYAHDISYYMSILFTEITYHELLQVAKENIEKYKLPNIKNSACRKLIYDFHTISYSIPTTLTDNKLSEEKKIQIIKKLLHICHELKLIGNFHCLFAIVAGLNNIAITKTGLLIPFTEQIEKLTKIISPINNFKGYRHQIKKYHEYIPYLGITLFELKMEYEKLASNNNNFLEILDGFKSINIPKLKPTDGYFYCTLNTMDICDNEDNLYASAERSKTIKKRTFTVRDLKFIK